MTKTSEENRATAGTEYGIAPAGYRLPATTRLGRIRLQVSDLAHSIEYYEVVLGLRVLERTDKHALLGNQTDTDVLIELNELRGARPVHRRGQLGLYHFAILLPDRAALGRFVQHLSELGARAGMSDHFVSEAVYLTDPDGLGIEVYADRPRDTWRSKDRQLVMHTEPLDVQSVAAAGADARWTGAPAGTRMGHVHLHVSNLEEAAAFYHSGLGFDKIVWNYPGALFMSAGGYHHHLGTNTWAADAARAQPDDARLLEWTIEVPTPVDAQRAAQSIAAGDYQVTQTDNGWVAADPWGTRVRIRAVLD